MIKAANIRTRGLRAQHALVVLLLFSAGKVFAQQDTSKKLKEVDVKSSALPKVQALVPSQQISSSDFNHYAAFNVAEMASYFAGVNIQDYGGIGGLKTISVRSLGASHTGILYDGILLDDAQNGQIDLSKFNLYNIQNIALYNGQLPGIVQPARAFASASVLDIKTTRPKLSQSKPYQVTAGIDGGSFGLVNPYLQWQQRIAPQWSIVLNGNYTDANGRYKYKENGDGSDTLATRTNSDIRATETDGTLYWAKSDSNKFKIQFNYYNSDRGLPGPVVYYTIASDQRLQNQDFLTQASYEYIAKTSFHLLLNSKFSQDYLHYTDPAYLNNAGGENEHYTQHEFYQSASVGYKILPVWEVAYSSDAVLTNLFADVYEYAFPTRLTLLNNAATNLIFNSWRLQANLLHTYVTESVQSGTAAPAHSVFSPAVAVNFQPFKTPAFQLRAFYKDIFRYPTFAELYYYAISPRQLKPEQTKQYDVGTVYQKSFNSFFTDLSLTTDIYYNNIRDKIIYIPTRSPETPSVTNLGNVDIKGVDVALKSRFVPAAGWNGSFNLNYTFQSAVDVTDPSSGYYLDQIPYTPKNLLNINTGLSHQNWGVYYNLMLSSSRYDESNNVPQYYLAGYEVSSLSLVYHTLIGGKLLSTSVVLNNLFNSKYVIIQGFPMPGRSVRFSAQITI